MQNSWENGCIIAWIITIHRDYQPVIRYSLNGTESWGEAALTFVSLGDSGVNLTRYQSVSQESLDPGCSSLSPQSLNINSIPAGKWLTLWPPNYLFRILTHLRLCLDDAIHNFKWVKNIQLWQNGGQRFWNFVDGFDVLSLTCPKSGI